MLEYVKVGYQRFSDFEGRSSRSEFWYFYLFYFLVILGYSLFIEFLGMGESFIGAMPIVLFVIVNFIPLLALQVRRLHDVGQSGWFLLIALIPIIGGIVLLIFYLQESKDHTNKWGPPPGHADEESDIVDSLIK